MKKKNISKKKKNQYPKLMKLLKKLLMKTLTKKKLKKTVMN